MYTWRLDLGGGAGSRSLIKLAASDQTMNPPGYHQGYIVSQQVETVSKNEQQQQHLLNKRAWDVALGPLKALPMNINNCSVAGSEVDSFGFMMYMAGNTISIFPIMMVMMMVWRPIKTLLSVNATFKVMEQEYGSSLILHKIVFILGNLGAVALAVYKCHTMGLLPNHESDWLDFMSEPERLQLSLSFDIV
uniref:ER membrane protein complex subunit 4 n=1 Tax=Meloidogyne javanica TaxID=6303 RepID=A0A915MC94_MELJA